MLLDVVTDELVHQPADGTTNPSHLMEYRVAGNIIRDRLLDGSQLSRNLSNASQQSIFA